MIEVAVIDDPAAAEAALEPARARLLAQLTEPRSASMLATAVGLPRQKVNYHLRTLEQHGLVELVQERAAFTAELMQAVTSLVGKYHDEQAEGGREHHLVVAIHPSVTAAPDAAATEREAEA